jgi:hypothetical protein
VLLASSSEQRHVRLITNSGGDHADLFRRLSFAVDRLRVAASHGSVVIEIGERLERCPGACGFTHDQD